MAEEAKIQEETPQDLPPEEAEAPEEQRPLVSRVPVKDKEMLDLLLADRGVRYYEEMKTFPVDTEALKKTLEASCKSVFEPGSKYVLIVACVLIPVSFILQMTGIPNRSLPIKFNPHLVKL